MTADTDGNGQGAFDEVRRLAVARVRFGVVRNPATRADKMALLRDADGRLVIELQTASVPADRSGTFGAAVRTSREAHTAHDETGSLAQAIAAYFAQWVDDQTRTVWAAPVVGLVEVSAVLDRCQQSLLDAVKGQIVGLATGAGAPALPAKLGAGIGADLILAPEMRLEEDLSSIIDICVMGIGFAAGQPHLVAAAAKHLLHTEFDRVLEHGADETLEGLTGNGRIKPARPLGQGKKLQVLPVQQQPEHTDLTIPQAPATVQQQPAQKKPVNRPGFSPLSGKTWPWVLLSTGFHPRSTPHRL
jgi:hypothetical protein